MRTRPLQLRRPDLLAAALATVLTAMCFLLSPTEASAVTQYAHVDTGGVYTTLEALIDDLSKGQTVYMDADWEISQTITVESGKKTTIYMNGHTIKTKAGDRHPVFLLKKGAQLDLLGDTSGKKYEITYDGYVAADKTAQVTATTGGLLTSSSKAYSALIYGEGNNVVTLDGITVGGALNYSKEKFESGGAVWLGEGCALYMKNGASVEHNYSGKVGYRGPAGGVYVSENSKVVMDGSAIHDNYSDIFGGGIYSHDANVRIELNNGSSISNNHAPAGGGIYLGDTNFTITGDGTGSVSGNSCSSSSRAELKDRQSGGGIHINSKSGTNEGLIENITIADNYSAYDGGGLELDQRWTTVRNCTITGNTCKYEGGGVYDCNSHNIIDDCTITGNACNVGSGGNYEGGGVYVWCDYDLTLSNKCLIYGNTRGKGGSADDVFLRENVGATAKAYVTGNLAQGSKVGIRSGTTGDRRVAKNFKPASKDCLFYDLDGYYISYGTDEGGDAWQRHTAKEFAAKLNGETKGRYKWGAAVALVAPATKGDDQVFWYWNAKETTGLYPNPYITDKNCYNAVLGFDMPQNDVNVVATYATRAKQVAVGIDAPAANKDLPKTAQVQRIDAGTGGYAPLTVPVTWYKVGENGERTLAAGVAEGDATYVASFSCSQSVQLGLFFSKSLSTGDVTVKTTGGNGAKAASVKVDDATGALTVEIGGFARTEKIEEPKLSELDLMIKKKGYYTYDDVPTALALDDAATQASGDSLGGVTVTLAKGTGDVTVAAPAKDGYNFCNWEGVPQDWTKDDEAGTLTIPASALDDSDDLPTITAYYTPVVTEVEIAVDEPAPVAGKKLATVATSIVLKGSDGSEVDLADAMGKKQFQITWSPESEDGLADWSTSYSALIELAAADDLEGVEDVLATGAVVKVSCASGATVAEAAGFTIVDGQLCLAIGFPATSDLGVTSVSAPEAVEVSFEDALAYQAEGSWPLPRTVTIELQNGEKVDGDVEWEAVEGFDANATSAQELTVKGKVTNIAYEDADIADGYDPNVTVTVKVAAPQGSGSGDEKGNESNEKDDEKEADTETETAASAQAKAAAKKGTPSTGDVTYGGIAGLLVLAIACLVVARLSRRKN